VQVLGYARRPETVEQALEMGAIDRGSTDPADVLPHADLTVVCIPVAATIEFGVRHADMFMPGSIVTDVGSIKGRIVEEIGPALARRGVRFIGSHPMAGSERAGLAHADPRLFEEAVVFVSPGEQPETHALDCVRGLWRSVGATCHVMDAADHDALVARTSHVLHLLAAAAVPVGLRREAAVQATAGGFRDFTRIASGSPAMWRQIFELNQKEVLAALDEFECELGALRQCLAEGAWQAVEDRLEAARSARERWLRDWRGHASVPP
jgi:prephenate dehydrogenase